MLIQLLPFIIFVSSMKFIIDIRNNKDLLTLKVFGFSNFKIFIVLASTSFVLGWLVLFFFSPLSSAMSKYYEKSKASYSKDIDHLVTFNKNGIWIKEFYDDGQRIISATNDDGKNLKDVTIYNFDNDYFLKEKIFSKYANIELNDWLLKDVTILELNDNQSKKIILKESTIKSIYTYDKITNLFKNIETMSFVDLILNYNGLQNNGYNEVFLKQILHLKLSLPFFLFIMTALASILIMGALKKSNNFKFIIIGIVSCVIIYYLKDLSIALGQTNRISMTLAAWMPIIIVGLFSLIGILQINEK
jgi:lipopolysaccharide export system permease protein